MVKTSPSQLIPHTTMYFTGLHVSSHNTTVNKILQNNISNEICHYILLSNQEFLIYNNSF
jgi:hypothetical protein